MTQHQFSPIAETILNISHMHLVEGDSRNEDFSFVHGLLERSRRLLKLIIFLNSNDYGDCTDGLCRSILEHCATGLWLLEDIETRIEVVYRAHLRDLRLLNDCGSKTVTDDYHAFSQLISARWGDPTREAKLPPIEQRLIGPLSQRAAIYRILCARIHSSIISAALGLIKVYSTDPSKSATSVGDGSGDLPFSSLLVWGLAITLAGKLELPEKDKLADIAQVFEDYCRINGQGSWSLK